VTPEEKLRLAQRSYEAFARFDADALVALYDPDCEWRAGALLFDAPSVYTGHDGIRSYLQLAREATSSFSNAIIEAKVAEDGRLLLKHRFELTSAVMEVELAEGGWQEAEFRDGLILRITEFEEPPPGWDAAEPLALPQAEE
jgi:ketosteroid isomerase-like protein